MQTVFVAVVLVAFMVPVYGMGYHKGRLTGLAERYRRGERHHTAGRHKRPSDSAEPGYVELDITAFRRTFMQPNPGYELEGIDVYPLPEKF